MTTFFLYFDYHDSLHASKQALVLCILSHLDLKVGNGN